MFTEINALYSEITAEYINTICKEIQKIVMLLQMIHICTCVV